MALYWNAHHLNTRFKVMICALAIASVTRRTCVLSIVLVFTIIRITQGIRSGVGKLRFLQDGGKLVLLQGLRSLQQADDRSFSHLPICSSESGLCGYQVNGYSGGAERPMDFLPDRRLHQIQRHELF
ncbi:MULTISPECIES: hypothetical protein [unclassified Microcoleus]|uniref:hypothetical protein n=1 Tax=unclassified Microcoleus TaxID=2642155 RepID=UPI002FCFD1E0